MREFLRSGGIMRRAALTSAAIGMTLLLAACGEESAEQQAAPAAAAPPPTAVLVQTITPQRVSLTTELPGRTSAYMVSDVRPQVSGIIKERLFEEGSDVEAGQVLYQIDPAVYEAAYNNARAQLARTEANISSVRSKEKRYKELAAIDAVSKQDYDDAIAALRASQASLPADKAALDSAQINLDYTRVKAPISGRIGKSAVTPGALVTANQAEPLATVQQLDRIYVDVTQSSAEVLRLRRDFANGKLQSVGKDEARVHLILEDGSRYEAEGALQFSDITVDQSTGSISLRAIFPNPTGELLPGMYVRAVLEEAVTEQALLVPQRGVTRDAKGQAVALVVDENNLVQPRILKTERTVGDAWLVSEGIQAGDRVIIEGVQKVAPGAPVTPEEAGAAAPAATQQ